MICKSFLIAAITTSICALFCACSIESPEEQAKKMSGNPIFDGWYADPEVALFDGVYWVFPTSSKEFKDQISFDAFSSEDLVVWKKHPNIIDNSKVKWLRKALWAPAIVEKDGKYYLFFSGNNPLSPIYKGWKPEYAKEDQYGGIGVAVSNSPEGPYEDLIGKPLISDFRNNAQPIDQYVFKYEGSYYMIYGGWDRCCLVKLADDFKSVVPFPDGSTFKNITPENYKEGSVMFERKGKWYFMWSEGNWTDSSYKIAYAIADTPFGPFKRISELIVPDDSIATGAGHHSVLNIPGTDDWYIFYHRSPVPNKSPNHRVTCVEKMQFNPDGTIAPIKMTREGVPARRIKQ